jgi:hypothetical protein
MRGGRTVAQAERDLSQYRTAAKTAAHTTAPTTMTPVNPRAVSSTCPRPPVGSFFGSTILTMIGEDCAVPSQDANCRIPVPRPQLPYVASF